MASGYRVNADKFRIYALDTAKKFLGLYDCYYFPSSVHNVLIHGADVIGELSGEASESRNKDIKVYRKQNTRKGSRIATNTDLKSRLLLSSDPFITGLRKLPCKL